MSSSLLHVALHLYMFKHAPRPRTVRSYNKPWPLQPSFVIDCTVMYYCHLRSLKAEDACLNYSMSNIIMLTNPLQCHNNYYFIISPANNSHYHSTKYYQNATIPALCSHHPYVNHIHPCSTDAMNRVCSHIIVHIICKSETVYLNSLSMCTSRVYPLEYMTLYVDTDILTFNS